eukprot:677830-Prymnesium_polylepis.1
MAGSFTAWLMPAYAACWAAGGGSIGDAGTLSRLVRVGSRKAPDPMHCMAECVLRDTRRRVRTWRRGSARKREEWRDRLRDSLPCAAPARWTRCVSRDATGNCEKRSEIVNAKFAAYSVDV